MIPEQLTDNELRTSFAKWLQRARHDREMPPIGIGFNAEVTRALMAVAKQGPKAKEQLITDAKLALERQLTRRKHAET